MVTFFKKKKKIKNYIQNENNNYSQNEYKNYLNSDNNFFILFQVTE